MGVVAAGDVTVLQNPGYTGALVGTHPWLEVTGGPTTRALAPWQQRRTDGAGAYNASNSFGSPFAVTNLSVHRRPTHGVKPVGHRGHNILTQGVVQATGAIRGSWARLWASPTRATFRPMYSRRPFPTGRRSRRARRAACLY